jgi:hypothetical protein
MRDTTWDATIAVDDHRVVVVVDIHDEPSGDCLRRIIYDPQPFQEMCQAAMAIAGHAVALERFHDALLAETDLDMQQINETVRRLAPAKIVMRSPLAEGLR